MVSERGGGEGIGGVLSCWGHIQMGWHTYCEIFLVMGRRRSCCEFRIDPARGLTAYLLRFHGGSYITKDYIQILEVSRHRASP